MRILNHRNVAAILNKTCIATSFANVPCELLIFLALVDNSIASSQLIHINNTQIKYATAMLYK